MSSSSGSAGRAIGVRFAIVVGAVFMFPFPIGALPGTEWLETQLAKPLEGLAAWLGQAVLGLGPPVAPNGSGDQTYNYVGLLVVAIIATVATVVWTALDRRRTSYPRLVAGMRIWLRYVVGYMMLSYGFSKVLKSQFPDLHPARLAQPIGDLPPMGLLWTFMGASLPYTVFAGLAEVIGGALLLWRRTATIGALVIVAVMTNVVMLNFCYDVPVKLFSTQLLVMAVVISLPRARALLAVALGHAAPEAPPRPRMSARWERARRIANLMLIAGFGWNLYAQFSQRPSRNRHVHELYGAWQVDQFISDGVEHAPLTTDAARWRLVAANPTKLVLHPMTGPRELLSLAVDAAHQTMTVTLDDADKDRARLANGANDVAPAQEVWRYTRPTPDRLVIDGVHRGAYVHVAMHLAEPAELLVRGFHWINEEPRSESRFNR